LPCAIINAQGKKDFLFQGKTTKGTNTMTVDELIQLLVTYAEPNDTITLLVNGNEMKADLEGVDRDLPEEQTVGLFFNTLKG
jgi:hypothetical protein